MSVSQSGRIKTLFICLILATALCVSTCSYSKSTNILLAQFSTKLNKFWEYLDTKSTII